MEDKKDTRGGACPGREDQKESTGLTRLSP